ncbi:hypothetical protein [Ottowia oryzae]|nr:hypothetical protein [Ottowia oryzae]
MPAQTDRAAPPNPRPEPVGPPERNPRTWMREELLQLLSVAGTLAGLSITAVALLHSVGQKQTSSTIADDVLVLSALLFLLCTYAIFIALRTRRPGWARRLEQVADVLFLLAMTGMVASGFIMVYTLL